MNQPETENRKLSNFLDETRVIQKTKKALTNCRPHSSMRADANVFTLLLPHINLQSARQLRGWGGQREAQGEVQNDHSVVRLSTQTLQIKENRPYNNLIRNPLITDYLI